MRRLERSKEESGLQGENPNEDLHRLHLYKEAILPLVVTIRHHKRIIAAMKLSMSFSIFVPRLILYINKSTISTEARQHNDIDLIPLWW